MVSEVFTDKKRRKSIAAIRHARPSTSTRRRRAHSLIGSSNSPITRRNLQPRKSILKIPVSIVPDGPRLSNTTTIGDETQGTESMDITRRESLNLTRKSLSRRVSFANHAQVRMFSTPGPGDTTVSSTASTQSPPASPENAVTDENNYPGSQSRRRSNMRQSMAGTEDMDISERYQFSSDEDFSSDAPTEDVGQLNLPEQTTSSIGDQSQTESEVDGDATQHMEYTVPLAQALRPAQSNSTYMALMEATHAGHVDPPAGSDDDFAGNGSMDLGEAEARLVRARSSLSNTAAIASGNDTVDLSGQNSLDDTLSSMGQDEGEFPAGDETVNLSRILGRASFGAFSARTSFPGSEMDISGDFTTHTMHSTPRPSMAPSDGESSPFKADAQGIFNPPEKAPATNENAVPSSPRKSLTVPRPFVFSKPPSPEKSTPKRPGTTSTASPTKSKPQFTAAFAPPASRPSPRKSISSGIPAPSPSKSPNKRPRESENDLVDMSRPSPAKRQALADRWEGSSQDKSVSKDSATKPKPLSPNKRAPFQDQTQQTTQETETTAAAKSSQIRRPSSYFARRKSFIPTPLAAPTSSATSIVPSKPSQSAAPASKKSAGRQSTGSAAPGAWLRFDKNAPAPSLKPPAQSISSHPAPPPALDEEVPAISSNEDYEPQELDHEELSLPSEAEIPVSQTALAATERWRAEVQQPSAGEDSEQTPQISIKQFFEMTDVAFMDELQAPRRSMHPSTLQREARNTEVIPLAEYAIAIGVDLPQLHLYKKVGEDLEAWVQRSKNVNMKQAEEEAALVTPELFVEYVKADEEGQADIVHQLKLIKTNSRSKAKCDWYDWKLRWIQDLEESSTKVFASLEKDAQVLARLQDEVNSVLPDLQQKYDEIMAQLEQEQAEVADIEASDQDYLTELKTSIQEQSIEVEELRADANENVSQLRWLEERIVAIEQEEKQTRAATAEIRRRNEIRLNSTRADVFRLRDELKALEHLHLTAMTKVQPDIFEFVYASQLRVTIPCVDHLPVMSEVDIQWEPDVQATFKEELLGLRSFFLKAARRYIVSQENLTTRQIVQRLSDFWSSCSQLRKQLEFLKIKFPVELRFLHESDQPSTFQADASILFPSLRARATVSFNFPLYTYSSWPRSSKQLDYNIQVVYGPVQLAKIEEAIRESLTESQPDHNPGWLLDACALAVDTQS